MDDAWAQLTGASEVWIDRQLVVEVRPVLGGISFATTNGELDGVLVWTGTSTLAAFQRFGWPVPPPSKTPA